MRVRKMSSTGDYVFGGGQAAFYRDQVEGVAQCVKTRLALWKGEWFLDTTEGMDWKSKVFGKYTSAVRDMAIRKRILGTPGVKSITSYQSSYDPDARSFSVQVRIDTKYGQTTVTGSI